MMVCSPFFPQDKAKALFFQLFAVIALIKRKAQQTVFICPLKSIIEDQIAEAKSMGILAASAVDISED